MSIESIIGIVSGLIAISGAIYGLYRRFKKKSLAELMNQLVDKRLSTKDHQAILKKMNLYLGGSKISKEYIQGFALNSRGKEAVFKEICEENNIEPTAEICVKFMKADMKKIREDYLKKRAKNSGKASEIKAAAPSPKETEEQTVYMSELLTSKFPEAAKNLVAILEKHNIKYAFIKGTKDIWCRDYMPVRNSSGKLIQFKYDPSYLRDTPEHIASRSDVEEICKLNGIDAKRSSINLDGGNVLVCDGKAIISNRVFSENPDREKASLQEELAKLLECEIIIIPAINTDFTGHADGMVRFVNKDTILGNNREAEYKYWREGINKALAAHNLSYIDVPFFEDKALPQHRDSAIGIYVNYLELDKLIVMPVFGRDEDKEAFAIIQKAFPDKIIETIDYNDVALEGGLLNCSTWVN